MLSFKWSSLLPSSLLTEILLSPKATLSTFFPVHCHRTLHALLFFSGIMKYNLGPKSQTDLGSKGVWAPYEWCHTGPTASADLGLPSLHLCSPALLPYIALAEVVGLGLWLFQLSALIATEF